MHTKMVNFLASTLLLTRDVIAIKDLLYQQTIPTIVPSILPTNKLYSSQPSRLQPIKILSFAPTTLPTSRSTLSIVPTSASPSSKWPLFISSKTPTKLPSLTVSISPSTVPTRNFPSTSPSPSIIPSPSPMKFTIPISRAPSASILSTNYSFSGDIYLTITALEPTPTAEPINIPNPPSNYNNSNSKIKPRQSSAPTRSAVPTRSFSPSISPTFQPMSYHNNQSVLTGPLNNYNLFIGDYSDPTGNQTEHLLNYFSSHIGGSSWLNILSKYYQIENHVKTPISNSFIFKKAVKQPWQGSNNIIVNSEYYFISAILTALNSGALPLDTNAMYSIFFRGDVQLSIPGKRWLHDFCGFHFAFTLNHVPKPIIVTVVGDPSVSTDPNAGNCQRTISPNKNIGADSMIDLFAYEIADTITNPINPAWYNSKGQGVAGACAGNYGSFTGSSNVVLGTKQFLIQELWLPGHGCALSASF